MTKQEIIEDAYGQYWEEVKDFVDENGWVIMAISITRKVNLDFERKVMHHSKNTGVIIGMCVRPKSLQGIENNNGWIKIESEKDFPKVTAFYHVINKKNKYFRKKFLLHIPNYKDKWKQITHYQPIINPKTYIY